MGYSIEFINNLPKTMQTEISNLSSQIDSLEAQKATLQLPVDVVVSYELVKAKTDEAAKIIEEARQTASEIILASNASADAIYNSAQAHAKTDLASADNAVEDANAQKAAANLAMESVKAFQEKTKDEKSLLDLDRARFEEAVSSFRRTVSELIEHLSGI